MNRIILIGNGFDLAHKLKTSYKDFIDDYWKKFIDEFLGKIFYENEDFRFENINRMWSFTDNNKNFKELKSRIDGSPINVRLIIKNHFLIYISEKSSLKNWVDIENEYYEELIRIKNGNPIIYRSFINENENLVERVNRDFKRVESILVDYIIDVNKNFENNYSNPRQQNNIGKKIYYPLLPNDLNSNGLNSLVKFIENEIIKYREQNDYESIYINVINNVLKLTNDSALKSEIKNLLLSHSVINNFNLIPDNTLFLTFNYTNTHYLYDDASQFDTFYKQIYTKRKDIKIHGSIKIEDKNPIIFGYGDELDDEYKNIEKLNDNRFLENIKSIKYSETDNYKKMIEFIESDVFQVFIMGHSCGISDRTLLNTIFEHDNCVSIKPFYYKKEDGSDNYSDLVRNISRNFNDKIKMRDRVVNKEYSEPLN